MNEEKIGKFICKIRKEKNLTQKDLSKKLNVTDKAISRWETGKGFPDITLLIPLSEALGITVNELLSGELSKKDKKIEEQIKTTINLSVKTINKKEKTIKMLAMIFVIIMIILLYLSNSLSSIGVLEILIIATTLIILEFKKNKKKTLLIPTTILIIYTIYSFFTYTGSVRMQIFLMGHPIKAYTTSLDETINRRTYNERYYSPTKDIQVTSGSMGLIKCVNYYGLKLSSYYGF